MKTVTEEVTRAGDEVWEALVHLLPQLTPGTTLSREWLEEVVADPCTRLFVVRDNTGRIVATYTLAVQRLITGMKVWLEDVVVDAAARGRGIGKAIVRQAIAEARRMGSRKLDLTSSPHREAANRLYRSSGFTRRNTNVYRMLLDK